PNSSAPPTSADIRRCVNWRARVQAAPLGRPPSRRRDGLNLNLSSVKNSKAIEKRIELLRDVVPGLRRLAIMANVDNSYVALEIREVQAATRTLGLEAALFEIRRAEDIALAFDGLKGRAQALYVMPDPILFIHRLRINTLALGARLPTM